MPKVTEEHRAARRQQIVDAGRRLVSEQGFHKTTMADVIRESGLSAGAVYGYFKSKDEILVAIADTALTPLGRMFDKLLSGPDPVTPLDAVTLALNYITALSDQPDKDITRIALQAWAEALHDDTIKEIVTPKLMLIRGHYLTVIRRAQAAGDLDPAVDPEHIAQAMLGWMPGFIVQRQIIGDITAESYAAGIGALLGFRTEATPRSPRSQA